MTQPLLRRKPRVRRNHARQYAVYCVVDGHRANFPSDAFRYRHNALRHGRKHFGHSLLAPTFYIRKQLPS